jgi:hypothetical protein
MKRKQLECDETEKARPWQSWSAETFLKNCGVYECKKLDRHYHSLHYSSSPGIAGREHAKFLGCFASSESAVAAWDREERRVNGLDGVFNCPNEEELAFSTFFLMQLHSCNLELIPHCWS